MTQTSFSLGSCPAAGFLPLPPNAVAQLPLELCRDVVVSFMAPALESGRFSLSPVAGPQRRLLSEEEEAWGQLGTGSGPGKQQEEGGGVFSQEGILVSFLRLCGAGGFSLRMIPPSILSGKFASSFHDSLVLHLLGP